VKFCHDLPRNFAYEKGRQRTQLSAGYSYDSFQHRFSRYGILRSYSSSEHVMDRLDCSCLVRFLGHKMGETC
jgi:hypothetical protein